jgi:hypothetical protein
MKLAWLDHTVPHRPKGKPFVLEPDSFGFK